MNAQERMNRFMETLSAHELRILILVAEHNLLVKDVEFERLEYIDRVNSDAPAAVHLEGDFE